MGCILRTWVPFAREGSGRGISAPPCREPRLSGIHQEGAEAKDENVGAWRTKAQGRLQLFLGWFFVVVEEGVGGLTCFGFCGCHCCCMLLFLKDVAGGLDLDCWVGCAKV